MKVRKGTRGLFYGCAAYPKCRGTRGVPADLRKKLLAEWPADPVPDNLPKRVTNSVGMKLVLVPAGSFLMGSAESEAERGADEGPQRRVTIPRPFYLGVFPVTQAEYQKVMSTRPAQFSKGAGGGPTHPVEQVSWDDAVGFCRELSSLGAEKEWARAYRLPTEAEWEYACRAGTTTPFAFGESLSGEQANFDSNRPYGAARPKPAVGKTTKVGSYPANAWGLFDMHGNVWEWCADWYAEGYGHGTDGGPRRGDRRVLRGGSWNNSGHLCRSARRNKYAPDFANDAIGFRVVLSV
jgi:formylglycine-generating enzyme required for sulfatase activity